MNSGLIHLDNCDSQFSPDINRLILLQGESHLLFIICINNSISALLASTPLNSQPE